MEVLVSDDHLVVEADDFDEPLQLLPQGPMQFFDIPDGDIWKFDYDGQNITGFTLNGWKGKRIY
jgi:hypothetical protein